MLSPVPSKRFIIFKFHCDLSVRFDAGRERLLWSYRPVSAVRNGAQGGPPSPVVAQWNNKIYSHSINLAPCGYFECLMWVLPIIDLKHSSPILSEQTDSEDERQNKWVLLQTFQISYLGKNTFVCSSLACYNQNFFASINWVVFTTFTKKAI